MLKTAPRSTAILLAGIAFVASFVLLAPAALAVPTVTPSASWTPNPPTRPSVNQTVTFTADVNWDGAEGTVSWDFGDGTTGTGTTATHAYGASGLKFVTATATNGETPAVASVPTLLFVTVNSPPAAEFSWSPASGTSGQDVFFASESDDPDGPIASYAWNFGDGVTDARRTPEHPFASAGTKTVRLTVTDAYGATSTVTHQVLIQGPPVLTPQANKPPVATFAFGPRSPQVGDSVDFVSSAVDPDGSLRSQTWDLDGDGQFDDGRGDEVLYTFVTPGSHTVRLRVEDNDGGAAVHERTLVVRSPPVAKAGFLTPAPVIRLNGQLLSRGSRITVLSVHAPKATLVTVKCRGKSCPVSRRRKRVKSGSVRFKTYERFLRAGVKLEIFSRKPHTIGAYTRYTIRAGKPPARTDRCLEPGKDKPLRHCS